MAAGDPTANYKTGLVRLQQGRFAEAISLLELVRAIKPSEPAVLLNLATGYFNLGRYDAALECLLECNRAAPGSPLVLLSLAQTYLKLGKDELVLSPLEDLVTALRQNPQNRINSEPIIRQAGIAAFAVHARDTASYRPAFIAAQLLFLASQHQKAISVLGSVAGSAETNPEYFNLLGMCYAGLNDLPKGSQAVIKAINLAPDRADFLFNLAGIYQKARDNEAAINVLNRAVAKDPASPEIHFALALSSFNLGNFTDSVGSCRKAVRLDPMFDKAYLLMGRSYSKLSQPAQAAGALHKAVSLNPSCEPCLLELAVLLADNGSSTEASRRLREALKLNPKSAPAHYRLGKLLSERGETKEAIRELETAITLDPDHDGAYYQLGRLYTKTGNKQKAQAVLQAARDNKEKRRAASQQKLSGSTLAESR